MGRCMGCVVGVNGCQFIAPEKNVTQRYPPLQDRHHVLDMFRRGVYEILHGLSWHVSGLGENPCALRPVTVHHTYRCQKMRIKKTKMIISRKAVVLDCIAYRLKPDCCAGNSVANYIAVAILTLARKSASPHMYAGKGQDCSWRKWTVA